MIRPRQKVHRPRFCPRKNSETRRDQTRQGPLRRRPAPQVGAPRGRQGGRPKRALAKRRKRILNNLAVGASGVAVLALLLFLFGAFGGSDPAADPQASASASAGAESQAGSGQLPADADPALQTKPTVTAGTGDLTELKVTPLITGTGAAVQDGQALMVNYVGVNYVTGEEFDTSHGKQPFTFTIGRGEVIKGWDQGLLGVTVGSRVQIDIPAELAYGESGDGATSGPLRFVVDVLSATLALWRSLRSRGPRAGKRHRTVALALRSRRPQRATAARVAGLRVRRAGAGRGCRRTS